MALTSLPATGNPITRYNSYPVLKQVLIAGPNATLTFNDATKSIIVDAAASGTAGTTAVWGGITGTLSDQLDLQNALNAKVNASALAAVATSGLYSDLSGRPTLATVATTGAYADLSGRPVLAAVATSGAYSDLTGRPSLATVATSGLYSDLSGRPTLAAIATSGSASDLSAGTVPAARLPAFAGGDVTSPSGSLVLSIGAHKVSRGMLAATAAAAILGSTAAGDVTDLTPAQAKSVLAITASDVSSLGYFATGTDAANLTGTVAADRLPIFSSSATGAVPASGGGTTNFLRADGSWAAPGGTTSYVLDLDAGSASDTFTSGIDIDGGSA